MAAQPKPTEHTPSRNAHLILEMAQMNLSTADKAWLGAQLNKPTPGPPKKTAKAFEKKTTAKPLHDLFTAVNWERYATDGPYSIREGNTLTSHCVDAWVRAGITDPRKAWREATRTLVSWRVYDEGTAKRMMTVEYNLLDDAGSSLDTAAACFVGAYAAAQKAQHETCAPAPQ